MIQFIFILRLLIIVILTLSLFLKYKWEKMAELFLYTLNVSGNTKEENLKKYLEFKNKPNGVVVFTHSTCFDHFILFREFKESLAALVKRKAAVFPFNILMEHSNCILFDKGSNTAQLIQDIIKNRKSGDPVVGLAPSAANSNDKDQNKLEEFKMGAFLPMTPVLPVLIKIHPYENWKNEMTFMEYVYIITTYKEKIYYTVKVLDEVTPKEGETPEQLRDRVKLYMEEEMVKIDVLHENKELMENEYKGNMMLFLSSHLFLISSLACFYEKKYVIGFFMLLVYITSIFYHYDGNHHYEFIDKINARFVGITLIIMCLLKRLYISPIIAVFSYCIFFYNQYVSEEKNIHCDFSHLLLIHIPIFIAFMFMVMYYNNK